MRDLFTRLAAEGKDMRPLPWCSTQTTCHGVSDNIRPFLGIMGLIPYACIKESALKAKVPRLRQERLEVANRSGQPTHARERTRSTIPNNARLFRSFVGHIHQQVEMIGHHQAERHEPLARHMVVPHRFQDPRRIFHKTRHAARPGTDCHEEERPRRAIGRVMIEAFTNRQIVHVFQCSTNEIPAQRPPPRQQRNDNARTIPVDDTSARAAGTSAPTNTTHTVGPHTQLDRTHGRTAHGRAARMVGADVLGRPPPQGRHRWTIQPRGPPGTSAPTNTTHPWCAEPHTSCDTHGPCMVGADVLGRPPPQGRCRWTIQPRGPPGRRPLPTTRMVEPHTIGPHIRSAPTNHAHGRTAHGPGRASSPVSYLPFPPLPGSSPVTSRIQAVSAQQGCSRSL